jgi:hypothetical protein
MVSELIVQDAVQEDELYATATGLVQLETATALS